MRDSVSAAPPAAKPCSSRIGRVGYSWALAALIDPAIVAMQQHREQPPEQMSTN